jgi:hypothetical protein
VALPFDLGSPPMSPQRGRFNHWSISALARVRPYQTRSRYRGVARKTAMRKPTGEVRSANCAVNASWSESLRPSSQKVRF